MTLRDKLAAAGRLPDAPAPTTERPRLPDKPQRQPQAFGGVDGSLVEANPVTSVSVYIYRRDSKDPDEIHMPGDKAASLLPALLRQLADEMEDNDA